MATEKKPAGGRFHRLHVLLRLLIWTAIVFILSPLILVLAVHIPIIQKQVIGRIEKEIERSTSSRVQIGSYLWWPFSRLYLLNLRVKTAGKDLLECERVELSYTLSFVRPYIVPREMVLDRPALHLERDGKGRFQIPGNKSEPGEKVSPIGSFAGLRTPVPKIRIRSGTVDAQQDGQPVLAVRDVTGLLTLQEVGDSDGVSIKIDFGQRQGNSEKPEPEIEDY